MGMTVGLNGRIHVKNSAQDRHSKRAFLMGQMVKNLPVMQETWV